MSGIVLTDAAEKLLDIIEQGGENWQSRKDIAEKIAPDRTRLYDGEAALLDIMAANGVIEKEERKQKAVLVPYYRAKQNG